MNKRSTRCLHALLGAVLLAMIGASGTVHAQSAVDPLPFKNHAQEVRFHNLTRQLRCLVCQDESLAASNAELAVRMRGMIFRQMQKGWSDEQIKQYLADRYSAYVLYKPPLRPSTWLLWFGPLVILLIGAGVVVVTVRRRKAGAPQTVPDDDDDDW